MKCPITNKEGYVKEEDCHCFCCGIHEGVVKDELWNWRIN